jgi:hypothetical protein
VGSVLYWRFSELLARLKSIETFTPPPEISTEIAPLNGNDDIPQREVRVVTFRMLCKRSAGYACLDEQPFSTLLLRKLREHWQERKQTWLEREENTILRTMDPRRKSWVLDEETVCVSFFPTQGTSPKSAIRRVH